MRISLCEDLCPLLTTEVTDKLIANKVISVEDLVLCDLPKVRQISRQSDVHFQTLLDIRDQLYTRFVAKPFNAFKLYNKTISLKPLKTTIKNLDQMLPKGIPRGQVTQIYGESGSGKTQFCYTLMASVAKLYGQRVLYFDTELSFDSSRLIQIINNRFPAINEQKLDQLLDYILVTRVFDLRSILDNIEAIDCDLQTNPLSEYKQLKLIIIDSMSSPATLEMKKTNYKSNIQDQRANSSGARKLHHQLKVRMTQMVTSLRAFAVKHSMAIIVVNSQVMAKKYYWNNSCNTCLQFVRHNEDINSKEITISLMQSYDTRADNHKSDNKFTISLKGIN
ncbi:DNA repair protein RAD51 homolog 4-like isoform X1 [Oppia nitens]|uniref:DNA repair protein RAD51 homolog 4-like isoform X1 n=1 Tax=Oppia nitens TaxID=1686743 RepID=UPI0023DBB5EF|nr:DNA repair protein RAD51 homolog 4-like isoform X1 [Oppia nitens]